MASGIPLALRRIGIGSVTVRNHMLTYPVVDPVGHFSRGGDCRHWGASLSRCRAAHLHLPFRARPPNVRAISRVPDKGLSFAKTRTPPRVSRVGDGPERGSGTL